MGKAARTAYCLRNVTRRSLHIRYEIYQPFFAHIHRKKILIRSPLSHLQCNSLLGRRSSLQSIPGSSHTCPVLLLSTKMNLPLRPNRCTWQVLPVIQKKASGHISDYQIPAKEMETQTLWWLLTYYFLIKIKSKRGERKKANP